MVDPELDRWGAKVIGSPLEVAYAQWARKNYSVTWVEKESIARKVIDLFEQGVKLKDLPPTIRIFGDLCIRSYDIVKEPENAARIAAGDKYQMTLAVMRPYLAEIMDDLDPYVMKLPFSEQNFKKWNEFHGDNKFQSMDDD